MNTALRILIVIVCIVALYYLVVLLARGVAHEGNDVGLAPVTQRQAVAAIAAAAPRARTPLVA